MTARAHGRRWLLTLVCVTLLAVRVDGAHLHLCLDGQEQSSSLRIGADARSELETQAPHDDRDLALAADLLAKSGKGDLKHPLALLNAEISLLVAATELETVVFSGSDAPSTSSIRLPPLRGPPAYITA